MVEDPPTLFRSMRKASMFQPVGPIARTRLAAQKDVVRDVGRFVMGARSNNAGLTIRVSASDGKGAA